MTGKLNYADVGISPRGLLPASGSAMERDRAMVSRLDIEYQAAVKYNDVRTLEQILSEDFLLITGSGKRLTKSEIIEAARNCEAVYQCNDEIEQSVRIVGDIAIVTALLWEKGVVNGEPFDRKLWFSDVYMRRPLGWRYVFGQSSLPLPDET